MPRSFLEQSNERRLDDTYQGDVLLWDIDKTYLDTHFSSWRGLFAIPFELAIDKEPITGSVPLLRALRRGPGESSALVPLYFVSGSPLQLRSVIERRMTLDGVQFDGITFKDQLGLARTRRLRDLTHQLGYKLQALLLYRRALPPEARWLMFGDDVEQDAETFALFGDVCAGMPQATLKSHLEGRAVHADDLANILAIARELPTGPDPVERIFIHRARGTDPSHFPDPRVVATESYLQTGLVLAQMGKVRPEVLGALAKALRQRGVLEVDLARQMAFAHERWGVDETLFEHARPA